MPIFTPCLREEFNRIGRKTSFAPWQRLRTDKHIFEARKRISRISCHAEIYQQTHNSATFTHTHTEDRRTQTSFPTLALSSSLHPSFIHSFVRSFGKSFTGLLAKNYYPSKYSSRITTTGKYSYGQGLILQADTSVG